MSKLLYRWGRTAALHPGRTIAAWTVVAIVIVGLDVSIGGPTSDEFAIPGSEAQRGIDLLDERFPSQGGVSARVVFADPDGDITDAVARGVVSDTLAAIEAGPNVLAVTDPFEPGSVSVSADGRIA